MSRSRLQSLNSNIDHMKCSLLSKNSPRNTVDFEAACSVYIRFRGVNGYRAEQLVTEKKILAGGAVLGRVALRFIVEADSLPDLDRIVTSLPVWTVAETRVTPLIALNDRRIHVQSLLEGLASEPRQR